LREENPIRNEDRFLTLDVLRGVSLFGILLVNMAFYTLPMFYYPPGLPQWSEPIDRHLDTLIRSLGETEFLTIFSFLFGLGFALQLTRVKPGGNASAIFFRRVWVLLAFGLFHAFFVWMGDVLVWYAVVALALFLFRDIEPRRLLLVAAFVLVLRIIRLEWLALHPLPMYSAEVARNLALERVQECLDVYAHGSFADIFTQRARDVWFQYQHPVDTLLHILFIFLVGFYAGKAGLLRMETQGSRELLVRIEYFGFIFGVGGHLLRYGLSHIHSSLKVVVDSPLVIASDLALATFFVTSVVLAMHSANLSRFLAPFAAIGRSTLTNYLCQSLIVTTLAYSYGFGLYGKLKPLDWCILALAIYGFQLLCSQLWLRYFTYGPAEWLWRSLVYGKRIPLMRTQI